MEEKYKKTLIIIIIALFILGSGSYLYYSITAKKIILTKSISARYKKGPNLPIIQKDINNFLQYSPELDALMYQKSDKIIYETLLNFTKGKKEYPLLETYGANLISMSPDGKYAIIYYQESPQNLPNAKNCYFLAELETNNIHNIGENLSNFTWAGKSIYFIRNTDNALDLLLFNLEKAYGTDWGSVQYRPGYDKITDIIYPVIAISYRPKTNLLYLIIASKDSYNNFDLATYDLKENKFSKITDTNASVISFSPSGKHFALFNASEDTMTIYDAETNKQLAEILQIKLMPLKILWSFDEKNIYYFAQGNKFFENKNFDYERKRPTDITHYYDLIKYNLESNNKTLIMSGKEKNIANPLDFFINLKNDKIILMTFQTNSAYEIKLK